MFKLFCANFRALSLSPSSKRRFAISMHLNASSLLPSIDCAARFLQNKTQYKNNERAKRERKRKNEEGRKRKRKRTKNGKKKRKIKAKKKKTTTSCLCCRL